MASLLSKSSIHQSTLDDARNHLLTEGWAVIPNVLTEEETKTALARLWEAKTTNDAHGNATSMPFLDPNASNIRIFYLLEHHPIFRELISHPIAIQMVRAVLEDNFLISNFTANIARPGSKSMALHSDQSIVMPGPWRQTWAVNCVWCLTDVHKENGATMFIPGSNKWVHRDEIPDDAPKMLKPFEAKAGSIILMDGRVWHTSGANVTEDQDRALLFGYYTAGFLRQQVNWTAKLPKELQETLSEDMKNWLGLHPEANLGKAGDLRYMSVQYPDAQVAT